MPVLNNIPTGSEDNQDNATNTPAERWAARIEKAEKQSSEYIKRADKVAKIYADERGETNATNRQYAMLWSNTEVLKPSVYSRPPNPVVTRRFRDKDPVGRQVSDVMERALIAQFELNDLDDVARDVRDDFILVARGTAWARYEAQFNADNGDKLDTENVLFDHVHYSDFIYPMRRKWRDVPWVGRRVHMDDFAIEKRFGKEKLELVKTQDPNRLQGDSGGQVTQATRSKRGQGTTEVYEVWDKHSKKVYWIVKGLKEFMDERDPPLKLKGFFPTPKPAFGTLPTDSLIPIPDYRYYMDQAEEINDLTEKIAKLTEALKMVGWYPAAADGGVSQAIEAAASPTNQDMMIPVPSWAQFVSGGGARELVQWWPVELVINTIAAAIETRRSLIGDIFQITGISDIVRGESDARETLGAQELKAQFGAVRIRDKQRVMQRYIQDMTKIAAEIIAELFSQETLAEMTGIQLPTKAELDQERLERQLAQALGLPVPPNEGMVPDAATLNPGGQGQQLALPGPGGQQIAPSGPDFAGSGGQNGIPALVQGIPVGTEPTPLVPNGGQEGILDAPDQDPTQAQVTWDQVIELMRNDKMRGYRIEIETDSTVEADETREREERNALVEVVAVFMERVAPILQAAPSLGRMLGELLMFQLRAYRIGRQLEQIIEESLDALIKEALDAAQEPDPEPEAVQVAKLKIQAEQAAAEAGQEIEQIRMQNDQAIKQQDMVFNSQERVAQFQSDQEMAAAQIEIKREEAQAKIELERFKVREELELQRQKQLGELAIKLEGIRQQAAAAEQAEGGDPSDSDGPSDGQLMALARELTTQFADAINAPRSVVRDDAGNITGSEPG